MAIATKDYASFIGGETVETSSGETRELREPATGEPLGSVTAARAALDGDWGRTPANERSHLLHALADAIFANRSTCTWRRRA